MTKKFDKLCLDVNFLKETLIFLLISFYIKNWFRAKGIQAYFNFS